MLAAESPSHQEDWRLLYFDEVGSTQDVARSMADRGAGEGTLVVAACQTSGRGRRGRAWNSPEGNLHASLIVDPRAPAAQAGQIAFVAGLALADAITEECSSAGVELAGRLKLKWPNDILIDGAKVAGLLLEAEPTSTGRVERMIIGAGVNVVAAPGDTPYPATSLRDVGAQHAQAMSLARGFIPLMRTALENWRTLGFGPVLAAWTSRAQGLGEPITVRERDGEARGVFRGLDPDGALLLDLGDKAAPRRILTGDIFFASR